MTESVAIVTWSWVPSGVMGDIVLLALQKNDKEKAYMQLQQAHTAQQALLMKYQDKSAKYSHLEETVRAQEKVIAKMERLFHQKGRTIKDAGARGGGIGGLHHTFTVCTICLKRISFHTTVCLVHCCAG